MPDIGDYYLAWVNGELSLLLIIKLFFLEPYNPNNLDIKGKNEIHELILSYGIQYLVFKNLIIGNSIGGGVYFERFVDSLSGKKRTYDGFNGQFRLFAQYSF